MELRISFIFAILMSVSGCALGQIDGPGYMTADAENSARKSYNFSVSTEVSRLGDTSQRFEIRHGDCGVYDCENDRRRHELLEPRRDTKSEVGEVMWYGWSIYLPEDFSDLSPTNTTLGQLKLYSWRGPVWNFNIRQNSLVFQYRPEGAYGATDCRTIPISQMRGRWTDIVVFSDHRYQRSGSNPMTEVWVNGRSVCVNNRPLLTPKMVSVAGRTEMTFRYGIYNSYVSRWLNQNRTRAVGATGFSDYHADSGGTSVSFTNRPFEFDWGVELPTQVAFYDAVAIGKTREEVDVRMIESRTGQDLN